MTRKQRFAVAAQNTTTAESLSSLIDFNRKIIQVIGHILVNTGLCVSGKSHWVVQFICKNKNQEFSNFYILFANRKNSIVTAISYSIQNVKKS